MKNARLLFILMTFVTLTSLSPVYAQEIKKTHDENQHPMGQLVLADYENPITNEQTEVVKASVILEFERVSNILTVAGKPTHPLALPAGYEGEIVAYSYFIDCFGVPNQYVGIAGAAELTEITQEKAREWYQEKVAEQVKSKYNARGADWGDPIGSNYAQYYSPYYGGIFHHYNLYWLHDDNNSTYDWFLIKHFVSIEPGKQVWDSDWESNKCKPLHNWSWGSIEDSLISWGPLGTSTGSQGVDVSVTGGTGGAQATLGWSYQQAEVERWDRSSPYYDKAEWELKFNGNSREATNGMTPGSVCQVFQPTSGTYNLLELSTWAEFQRTFWLTTCSFSISWGLQVTYN